MWVFLNFFSSSCGSCWKSTAEAPKLRNCLLFLLLCHPKLIKFSNLQALFLLSELFDLVLDPQFYSGETVSYWRSLFFLFTKHMWSKPDKSGLSAFCDDSQTTHTPTLLASHPPGFLQAFPPPHSSVCLFIGTLVHTQSITLTKNQVSTQKPVNWNCFHSVGLMQKKMLMQKNICWCKDSNTCSHGAIESAQSMWLWWYHGGGASTG